MVTVGDIDKTKLDESITSKPSKISKNKFNLGQTNLNLYLIQKSENWSSILNILKVKSKYHKLKLFNPQVKL